MSILERPLFNPISIASNHCRVGKRLYHPLEKNHRNVQVVDEFLKVPRWLGNPTQFLPKTVYLIDEEMGHLWLFPRPECLVHGQNLRRNPSMIEHFDCWRKRCDVKRAWRDLGQQEQRRRNWPYWG